MSAQIVFQGVLRRKALVSVVPSLSKSYTWYVTLLIKKNTTGPGTRKGKREGLAGLVRVWWVRGVVVIVCHS